MKLFNYGSPLKYSAGSSIEVAITNLSRRVNKMDIATAISSSVPESKLSGSVAENSVVLYRVRPFVWNLFKPHFHGSFKKEGDRVVLGGVYTMAAAAKLIFSAFLIILVIVEVVFLFGTPEASQSQMPIPTTLFIPAIAVALLVFMFVSKWIFKSDVKWISDEVQKALVF